MKYLLLFAALTLCGCSTEGFAKRPPGSPAKVEVTVERSVTRYH